MMRTAIICLLLLTASLFSTAHASFRNEPVLHFHKKGAFKKQEPASSIDMSVLYASGHLADDSSDTAKLKRKAKWSRWLGIGSLVGLIIPGVNLLSLPATIAAVITGYQVKRADAENKDATKGLKTGWFTIGFLLVIGFIVLLVTLPLGPR